MQMLAFLLNIFFGVMFFYCVLSVCYLFLFSLAGRLFYKKNNNQSCDPIKKIAILVPAYKEDSIILSSAANLLNLRYSQNLYDVYIIADSFQKQTLEELRKMPLHIIEVSFEKSTKTKSLNEGFRMINKPYDVALICDADNFLAKDFLKRIDYAFVHGAKAVQGRRVAKNLDTPFAILDACSEAINNNIFRKGANAIGLSSAVIGSGMAFEFEGVKKVLSEINAIGGFDKPLQLKIVEQGIKIQYLETALIFDEKVDSSQAFKQQRKRWISSQFVYLKQFFSPALKQLSKGNFSYFNLALANNFILPRAFLLIIFPVLILLSLLTDSSWTSWFSWTCFFYLLSLIIAIPASLINRNLIFALFRLPKAVGAMVAALFQMKKANKTFIHTVHTKTEVSNSLFKDH
jgi:cellulose synthase/poly-beta-1,6-N-acetylglucosamine synthase-like glycosyltransferase